MPVYGKGRQKRPANKKIVDSSLIIRTGKRRGYGTTYWLTSYNNIDEIERRSRFKIINEIKQKIRRTKGPITVLEWGCGKGKAISELAEKFGKKINAYGSGNTAYNEWVGNKKVKFIHATETDTLRYFKDSTLDFIYSCWGIFYVHNKEDYVNRLAMKLKPNGKLLISPYKDVKEKKTRIFQYRRGNAVFERKNTAVDSILITRIK